MNPTSPPDSAPPDELEALYRQAAAQDTSRPSEHVREAILAEAHLAAGAAHRRASPRRSGHGPFSRPWWGSIAASIAVAGLATLLWVHLGPQSSVVAPPVPRPMTRSESAAPARPPVAAVARAPTPPVAAPLAQAREVHPDESQPAAARQPLADAKHPSSLAPARDAPPAVNPPLAAAMAMDAAPASMERSSGASARAQTGTSERGVADDPTALLLRAARAGDLAGVATARQRGANLEAADGDGRTALMLATMNAHPMLVQALLAAGANPHTRDARGVTPLEYARRHGPAQIASALEASSRH